MNDFDTALISCASGEVLNLPLDTGSAFSVPLRPALNNVISYRVKDVSIPATYYTVDTVRPLTFGLQGNVTGAQSTVIPAGNYTATTLATTIQNAWFTLTGTNITVSFTSPQFRTVVTRTGGADATVAITATQLALPGMGPTLGFYQAIATAVTITSSNSFSLIGPKKILVGSNALNTGRGMAIRNGIAEPCNVIFAIWTSNNSGDIFNNIIPSDFMSFRTPQQLTKIDLYLMDENFVPIALNGFSWSITLEIRQSRNV